MVRCTQNNFERSAPSPSIKIQIILNVEIRPWKSAENGQDQAGQVGQHKIMGVERVEKRALFNLLIKRGTLGGKLEGSHDRHKDPHNKKAPDKSQKHAKKMVDAAYSSLLRNNRQNNLDNDNNNSGKSQRSKKCDHAEHKVTDFIRSNFPDAIDSKGTANDDKAKLPGTVRIIFCRCQCIFKKILGLFLHEGADIFTLFDGVGHFRRDGPCQNDHEDEKEHGKERLDKASHKAAHHDRSQKEDDAYGKKVQSCLLLSESDNLEFLIGQDHIVPGPDAQNLSHGSFFDLAAIVAEALHAVDSKL